MSQSKCVWPPSSLTVASVIYIHKLHDIVAWHINQKLLYTLVTLTTALCFSRNENTFVARNSTKYTHVWHLFLKAWRSFSDARGHMMDMSVARFSVVTKQ